MNKLFLISFIFLSLFSYGQDSIRTLKPVEVVGIKNDIREPITITKFSCDSFSFLNGQKDPFFVLDKISPSIYSQSDNGQATGYSYMRMRGLDQTRINYNLNGIPLNEMEDQGLYFSNMPGFYNYISNISVERGIGTSKYGNTSVAGSVNMETRDMSQKYIEFNGTNYSESQHFYNLFYSSGISKQGFSLQLGGSYINNNGFKEHSVDDGGSLFYSFGLVKKHNIIKLYGFNGIAHNQLAYLGVPKNTIIYNSPSDSFTTSYKTNLNMASDKDTFNQNFVCINWVNDKIEHITFNTSGYFSNVNGDYNSFGTLYGVRSYQGGIMSNMVYKKKEYILNIGINTNIYSRTHFGSDYNGYYYPSDTVTPYSYYKNTGHKEDVIAYIKATGMFGKFNIFMDIQSRYVNFNVTSIGLNSPTYNWIFINPKIGAKYLDDKNSAYVMIGLTSREPTRSDMTQNMVPNNMGANTDNSPLFLKQSTLQPEKVVDFEIGYGYHKKSFNFSIDGYVINIENEYAANGLIDPTSGFMVKNVLKSTLRTGIESEVRYKIEGFNLLGTLQCQYNKYWSDFGTGHIPFVPNFIGSGGISYSRWGFTLGFVGQLVGPMVMNLPSSQVISYNSDTYGLLNGYLTYNWKNWSVSFRVHNILDKKYYIPAGIGYTDYNGYHNSPTYYVGQTISPSLSVKFKL